MFCASCTHSFSLQKVPYWRSPSLLRYHPGYSSIEAYQSQENIIQKKTYWNYWAAIPEHCIAQNSLLPFWLPLFGVVTVPTTLWSCLCLTFKFDDDVDVVFFVGFSFAFAVVFCFCRFDGHEFTFDDEKDDNNDRWLSLSLSAPVSNFPGAPSVG